MITEVVRMATRKIHIYFHYITQYLLVVQCLLYNKYHT